MLQAGMASQTADRLKDLAGRLKRHDGFAEVVAAILTRRPPIDRLSAPSVREGLFFVQGRPEAQSRQVSVSAVLGNISRCCYINLR